MVNKKKVVLMSNDCQTETVVTVLEVIEILQIRMQEIREIKIKAIESGYLPPIWSSYHTKMLSLSRKLLDGYLSHKYLNSTLREVVIKRKATEIADEMGFDREEVNEMLVSLMSPSF